MNLSEIKKLLIDVQIIVKEAIQELKAYSHEDLAKNTFSRTNKREMKAKVDLIMNQLICNKLNKTGISILSEEGNNASYKNTNSHYRFIVDPLDGTVNFVRGLGPSAISIALFDDNTPIFGVVGNISSQDIIWGGKDIGSYCNHDKINVSNNTILSESVLCSGFPSRFENNDNQKLNDYTNFMRGNLSIRTFMLINFFDKLCVITRNHIITCLRVITYFYVKLYVLTRNYARKVNHYLLF